jgi:hypothetical protein
LAQYTDGETTLVVEKTETRAKYVFQIRMDATPSDGIGMGKRPYNLTMDCDELCCVWDVSYTHVSTLTPMEHEVDAGRRRALELVMTLPDILDDVDLTLSKEMWQEVNVGDSNTLRILREALKKNRNK